MQWRILLFLCVLSSLAKSQIVSGFVTDPIGKSVPFVSVYIINSSNGTVANSKGYYQIRVKSHLDTIVFSALGYEDALVAYSSIEDGNYDVQLSKSITEISEVLISKEYDFAKQVIKNAMEKRSDHLKAIQSYIAKAYVKVSLEEENPFAKNQKDNLNFIESYNTISYAYPNQWKVEKLGVKDLSKKKEDKGSFQERMGGPRRRSPKRQANNPNLFFSNFSDGNFNFYQNTLSVPKLGETPFISPIGSMALLSYNFEYEGGFYENNVLIHKIKVIPKRSADALFSGMLYIHDKTWSIAALELSLPSNALHFFKEFKVYQNFELTDSLYVLNRQEFFYKVKRGRVIMHGTVYSEFEDYQLNVEHVKGTFSNAIRITVDSAYVRDTTYWNSVRSVPLKENEKRFVEQQDSINAFEKSPAYLKRKDSINNRVTILDVAFNGIDHYNREKGVKWIIDPLLKQVKIAGVGGYRHALGGNFIKTFKNNQELNFDVQADYGFANQDLLGNGKISFTYLPKKFASLRVSGGSKYQMLSYMQNIATIFSRSNYVRNDFLQIGHYHELFNGMFLDLRVKYMKRTSIDGLEMAGWSEDLFGDDNKPRDFEPYNEFNIKVNLSYTPFQKYALEPNKKVIIGSKWPTFHARWEQGLPGVFDAKINYQLLKLGVTQTIKWNVFGTGKLAAWGGHYLHTTTVEYPNMTFFRGTDNYFFSHPIYTFQLLGQTHTALESFGEFHYIHHFNGMFIKKVPYLNRTKLETVVGGGALYINDGNFSHSEMFTGIEFPFKILDTKFKLGAYYAIAYSNHSDLDNMIKFGLNIFNPFANEWAY